MSAPRVHRAMSLDTGEVILLSQPPEKPDLTAHPWKNYLGIFYTIMSINMFSIFPIVIKTLAPIHPFLITVYTGPTSLALTGITLLYTIFWQKKTVLKGIVPLGEHKMDLFFLWIRAVISSTLSIMSFLALQYVTAADMRTVCCSAVIFVYIFGWKFLGESCGVIPIIMSILTLIGILIMTRPPALTGAKEFETGTLIGISLSFICMLLIGTNVLIARYINNVHIGVANCSVYIWGIFQGFILTLLFGEFTSPDAEEIVKFSILGILLALGLGFLVLALKKEEAGVVALIKATEIIFIFIWQWAFLGTLPDLTSVIGAILIVTAVVAVSLRKWVESLPSDNPRRRQLAFVLK